MLVSRQPVLRTFWHADIINCLTPIDDGPIQRCQRLCRYGEAEVHR